MKWTVGWIPSADKELTTLWTAGPDRPEITAAADTIDRVLKRDPLTAGEKREGKERILFISPLAVYFKVETEDRKVTVTSVWRVP
jgi:hypothetical protein